MKKILLVVFSSCSFVAGASELRKDRYIDVMERAFHAYGESGTRAYFERVKKTGVTEHGFPRLAADLAVLVARGRQTALRPLMEEMMGFSCVQMNAQNRGANDFSVRELVTAIQALERAGVTAPEKIRAWRGELAKIVPTRCYSGWAIAPDANTPVNNWAAFNAVSELARVSAGIIEWKEVSDFIERQIGSQMWSFTPEGMYRDPHNPMVYDSVTRGLMAVALHFGYAGKYRARMEEYLVKAAPLLLKMQSVSGEMPFGGRSNQCLHNEAHLALQFEWFASFFARRGEGELAGQCKDAALLALESIERWLAAAPGRHIKNRYPDMFGCEGYAYFDKYMITLASFIYLADVFADDTIAPMPCPARTGGYVLRAPEPFHKVFANAGGYFLEFDTAADFHYDGSGLGRVHKVGAPEILCLSVPFPGPEAGYGTGSFTNEAPMALCGCNDERFLDRCHVCGAYGRYTVDRAEMRGGAAEIDLMSENGFLERYRVDATGVSVGVRGANYYLIPVLETDGAERSEVVTDEKSISVTYQGWSCRWETDGKIGGGGRRFANRNGVYRLFHACGLNSEVDLRKVNVRMTMDKAIR